MARGSRPAPSCLLAPRPAVDPGPCPSLSADDHAPPQGPATPGGAGAASPCSDAARLRRRLRERDLCSGWPRPVPPARPLAVPSRPLQARKDGRMAPRRGCRARARARVICSRHRTVLGPVVACRRDGTVPAGVAAGGGTAPYRRLPARDRAAGCGAASLGRYVRTYARPAEQRMHAQPQAVRNAFPSPSLSPCMGL